MCTFRVTETRKFSFERKSLINTQRIPVFHDLNKKWGISHKWDRMMKVYKEIFQHKDDDENMTRLRHTLDKIHFTSIIYARRSNNSA